MFVCIYNKIATGKKAIHAVSVDLHYQWKTEILTGHKK